MSETRTVAWFSGGVSSAVSIKMAGKVDDIIYIHIDDHHEDTLRFVRDCEAWFGVPVQVMSSKYRTVDNAIRANGDKFIIGRHGGPCTQLLKKNVRKTWEMNHSSDRLIYIWGLDCNETQRAERLEETMYQFAHRFPLIEKGISKELAHKMLASAGIKRPAMYDLGYHNNNCVGCVRGGMGYWNKIRVDFPAVFAQRAAMERRVGATCISSVYLDELDPERGRHAGPICSDCGIMCEIMEKELTEDTSNE